MSIFAFKYLFKKPFAIEKTKYLHFSYSDGYAAYSNVYYYLDYNDGEYVITYKPLDVPEEEATAKAISAEEVLEIENILIKHEVYKWDGFHKSDKNVLDGDGFYFTYKRMDGEGISASGYMKYPNNYSSFLSDIASCFNKLLSIN